MKRDPGFYWIKIFGQWSIGKYRNDYWLIIGELRQFKDEEIEAIADMIPE